VGRAAAGRPAARDARPGAGGRRRGAGVLGRAGRGVPRDQAGPLLGAQGGQHLDCLPKSAQPAARKALAQIRDAEDREHAGKAVTGFAAAYGAKYPQAVAKITGDQEQLLAFYDFPAEHWIHLKTSNPIVIFTFSTVRLPTRVTKGPGSPAAGLAMVFKLIEAASERWRYVNGPHLAALVRAGAKFEKGVFVERPDEAEIKVAA
jgi:putative transposase